MTILFIIVILFDVKLTSGYANAYILLAQFLSLQVIVIHISSGLQYLVRNEQTAWILTLVLTPFYSMWSLDLATTLSPDICVGHHIGSIDSIALQYFPAFYSLSLIFAVYWLVELHARNYRLIVLVWIPFRRCFSRIRRHINPSASLINAFATFLVLSHSKLTVTSILLLMPNRLWNRAGHHVSTVLFYDGTVEYLGSAYHQGLFSLAIFILLVFVIFPPLLLLLYPWKMFQLLLTRLNLHKPQLIILMDCFQGCYKDGSDGGRDYRWFSAMYFFLRIVVFSSLMMLWWPWSFTYDPKIQLEELTLFVACILILSFCNPYKLPVYTKFDILIFLYVVILGSLNSYNAYQDSLGNPKVSEILMIIYLSLPALCATGMVSLYCVRKVCVLCFESLSQHLFSQVPVPQFLDEKHIEERAPLLSKEYSSYSDLPDRLLHPSEYTIKQPEL